MKIQIEYCTAWNYQPRAAGLAAEIKQAKGVECELIPSSGGVFEITVNGKKIFSKKSLGRFPEEGEVLRLLAGAPS